MAFAAWHVPVRLATGAFILEAGLKKRQADAETAKQLHGFASTAYPQVGDLPPDRFAQLLSNGEIAVGTALLTPIVPTAVAGAALTAFGGGLAGLYLKGPGLREEGSLKPTQQGTAIAKDVWLLAIGAALLLDSIGGSGRRKRTARRAKA